ncbi:MAG: hypothetical protein ACYCXA_03830 [Actinomycetes bacterium]
MGVVARLPLGGSAASGALVGEERDDVGVEGVVDDGDFDVGVVVVGVVADLEPEAFEEQAQVLVGGFEQADVEEGQLVEQVGVVGRGARLIRLQDGELVVLGSPGGFELAEAVPDAAEHGPVGVIVRFEGAHQTVLADIDVGQGAAQRIELVGAGIFGAVVEGAEVGGE